MLDQLEYTWSSEGEIAQFTVTWAFRDWNHTDPEHGWWADSNEVATGSVPEPAEKKVHPAEQ